jgi:transposase-like protein
MRSVRRPTSKNQPSPQLPLAVDDGTVTVAMIQALIPLGLRAVGEALDHEVTALAGPRYARGSSRVRWGRQRGSIYLADQKVALPVPRVRDRQQGREVPLATYAAFQTPRAQDTGLFRRVLSGISCREYQAAAEAVPAAFGLTKTSVSRRFIRASARELAQVQERSLADRDWLVLVLDGKTFAQDTLVIALGVTTTGEKRILGVIQTGSENKTACSQFLRSLVARGIPATQPILVILDGGKGLRAAVAEVFGEHAQVQRCQWHKRENVVAHLPKAEQPLWRRRLQGAYQQPTHRDVTDALRRVHNELRLRNATAAASLLEGLEETLTLHRLGVFAELGTSFKTTNLLESVMARVEARVTRVDRWRTSDQKLRWCAAALLAVEGQFRRVKGCHQLGLLARALGRSIPRSLRVAA